MLKNSYPGLFIAMEGLDGSGLSTQSELLRNFFRQTGKTAYLTKEPTNNVIGGLIRGALSGVYQPPAEATQLLFAADRSHHLNREILPMLKGGSVVVCDRYFWSSVAFGSLSLDREWLLEINKYALLPDISIFLKVSPKTCLRRIAESRFEFELYEKEEQLKKVWETYEWLARKFKKNVYVINGEGTVDDVQKRVVDKIKKSIKLK